MIGLGTILAQAPPDPIGGGAGWLGAGLLGSVLAWLLLVYLPAQWKQFKELLNEQAIEREKDREERAASHRIMQEEREKDRVSRHELVNNFQRALSDTYMGHDKEREQDRKEWSAALDKVLMHCQREMDKFLQELREDRDGHEK